MDSINKQQPEDNHEDLRGKPAISRLQAMIKSAPTCFFRTTVGTGISKGVRPMNVREVDDEGNLWFLSASDSHTNQELLANPAVQLFFQGSAHSDFLTLIGKGAVSTDKAKIKELWEPLLKTWFTEGIDDPRITVIKVTPSEGYYWDNKHGNVVAGIKMLIGAAIGKTLDDSIEGKLKVK